MPLIKPTASTVTIAAGVSSGTFTGGDVSVLKPGMVLFPGSYAGPDGRGRELLSVTPTAGGAGGTFTIDGSFATAFISQPFCVDPMGGNYSTFVSIKVLNYLIEFLGIGSALGGAAKQIRLARTAAGLYGAVLFGVESRNWFGIENRNVSGAEKLLFRAYPDGSTPVDVMSIDGSTGDMAFGRNISPKDSASGSIGNAGTDRAGLTVYSADTSSDAYMAFHSRGHYAGYFGLGTDGGWYVGGWSFGAQKDRVLTQLGTPYIPVAGLQINGSLGLDLSFAGPCLTKVRNTNAPANAKRYDEYVDDIGQKIYRCVSDDYTGAYAWSALRRSGTTPTEWNPYVNFFPAVDNTYSVGNQYRRFFSMGGVYVYSDPYMYMSAANGTPLISYDVNDYAYYDRAANAWSWAIGGVNCLEVEALSIHPAYDGGMNLGLPNQRWATVYAAGPVINTSDQNEKTPKRAFTDDELDAWGEVSAGAFQFLDSVASKGEDGARIHYGYIAQEVHAAFAARGIDAGRLALWCADERTRTVTRTRTITRPKMETVPVEETSVEIVDGKAVRSTRTATQERQITRRVPLVTADGRAVTQPVPDPDDDESTIDVPVFHDDPVTEEVEETYEEQEPTGEYRYGLRYDGCHVIEAAWQRRRADRIEARLLAIETRLAAS